jgi:two-component system, NarL family, nitrate/nitrite response regulator NarL
VIASPFGSGAEGAEIHVVIAADIRIYREGLAEILSRSPHVQVVGEMDSSSLSVESTRALRPDILVIDAAIETGLRTVRALAGSQPSVAVIVLAPHDSDVEVIEWAEAGVSGYVARDATLGDLLAAIENGARGQATCPPQVVATLLKRVAEVARVTNPRHSASLTRRESEIAQLINEGLSNKAIAARLGITLSTVKNHVHNILDKVNATSRGEAVARIRAS